MGSQGSQGTQDSFERMLDGLEFEGLDEINSILQEQQPLVIPQLTFDAGPIFDLIEARNYLILNGFPENNVGTKCILGTFRKDEYLSIEDVKEALRLCDEHPRISDLICMGAPNVAAKGVGTAAFKDAAGKQQMLRNLAARGGFSMLTMWRLVALDGDRRCAMCNRPSHTIPKNGVYCTKCAHKTGVC